MPVRWGRLFSYLRPYRWQMMLAIIALTISSGIGLAFPLVIVQILESVLNEGDTGQLDLLALSLVGLFFLQATFTFVQSFTLSYIGEHIVLDIRTSLYRHLQKLSLNFYASRRVGEIISRISNDVTLVRQVLTSNITSLLSQSLTLVGSVVIVFLFNPSLTLFVLGMAAVLVIIAVVFGMAFERLSTRVQDRLADSTVVAEEGLANVRIVKSFARESYETARYSESMQQTFASTMRLALFRAAFGALMAFLGFSAIAAILWFGGQEVIEGDLTVPQISGFLIYGVSIAASLGGLAGLYGQFREALGSIRRVFEVMDIEPSIKDRPAAQPMPLIEGRITFEDVTFQYEDGLTALADINLDIAPGEIVAVVGPTGAGKSTFINLVPRFYDPTAGKISIDGIDIRTVSQTSLRGQIGLVPQETILFGGTIRENIAYGQLTASEEDIIEAAKAANAHDFILDLPQQYDTIVGERGIKLSGGQRQRVAIARAIIKNPRILLLDEATSALDNASEALVQEALERLMQERTTIIIAHRLSTVKIADRIVVLDRGRIVESGSHDELLARNGLYAELYNIQFREREVGQPALAQ
jgi:subfamily B ATP-binding cassette protein MsbA